jgi:hypothetical protein
MSNKPKPPAKNTKREAILDAPYYHIANLEQGSLVTVSGDKFLITDGHSEVRLTQADVDSLGL